MSNYYSQWDIDDLDSWMGKDYPSDCGSDLCHDESESDLCQEIECRRCEDSGCNYCLMLE